MKKKIVLLISLMILSGFISPTTKASSPATLSLTAQSGDNVRVAVTGEPSTTIRLSFLPQGASTVTTIIFGTTDSNGNFSTSISSGGYGIPQGSPAYVTVNGMQSQTMLWPTYTSSLTLSKTNVNVAVGQSIAVTGSNALILAANGMSSVIGAVLSGSQVTITGLSAGSGALALCGANVGCQSISVVVGGSTSDTQVSFSMNNFTINDGQSRNIDIYGGSNNGFNIKSNSNPSALTASISGTSNVVSLYGNHTPGTATLVICSRDLDTNCANLNITVLSSTINTLSFSPNDITLNPGISQNVIVSGGPDNLYYISSNSNSGVVSATISGNTLTLVGGSNSGSAVVSVCSATVNATCGNISITLNLNSTTASETNLSFSQNVVSVAKNDSTNVTVTGGSRSGYVITANSNPSIVTANITGNTNIIAIHGTETGSSIITVCSASGGSICSSIYVTVGQEMSAISFSQSKAVLTPGIKSLITINGGSGTGKVISLNSNPNAIIATLNNEGNVLTLSGGSVSGTSAITICSATYSTNCATLNATYSTPTSNQNGNSSNPDTTNNPSTPATPTQDLIAVINTEASNVFHKTGFTKNAELENKIKNTYTLALAAKVKNMSADSEVMLTNFIAYGSPTTLIIGAGERAGVLSSYFKAFSKLPVSENEWADAIKIANGRWPSENSATALDSAKIEFKKIYKREAVTTNQNDYAAISIIAYGLRPANRNLNSESQSIKSFKAIYGHNPVSALAWDIVRAIAYSGATR